jgi:hypothetical protein
MDTLWHVNTEGAKEGKGVLLGKVYGFEAAERRADSACYRN